MNVLQCSTLALSSPAYGRFKIVAWMFLLQSKAIIFFFGRGALSPTFVMEGHVPPSSATLALNSFLFCFSFAWHVFDIIILQITTVSKECINGYRTSESSQRRTMQGGQCLDGDTCLECQVIMMQGDCVHRSQRSCIQPPISCLLVRRYSRAHQGDCYNHTSVPVNS